jgi:hypothetical protein
LLNHIIARLDAEADRVLVDEDFPGAEEFRALAALHLGRETVSIRVRERVLDEGRVQLSGTASLLDLDDLATSLLIEEAEDGPRFALTVQLPDGWVFADGFPDYPAYFDAFTGMLRGGSSFLDEAPLRGASLILTTHARADAERGLELAAGLSIVGEMALSGPLSGLRALAGDAEAVPLRGEILRLEGKTRIRCHAELPDVTDLAALPLRDVVLDLSSDRVDAEHSGGPALLLRATTVFAGTPLSLMADATPRDEGWSELVWVGRCEGGPDMVEALGALELEKWLSLLPDSLRTPAAAKLRSIVAALVLPDRAIRGLALEFEGAEPWIVIPDLLEVRSPSLTLGIRYPFDPPRRTLAGVIEGRGRLAQLELPIYADLPDLEVRGVLEGPSDPAPLAEVPLAPASSKLRLCDLSVLARPREETLLAQASLEGELAFALAGREITVADLWLAIARDREGLKACVDGMARLAGAEFATHVDYGATYTGRATASRAPLSDLLTQVLEGIPAGFPQCEARDVELAFTGGGRATLGARSDLDLLHLAEGLGIPLPEGFPGVALARMAAEIEPGGGRWSLAFLGESELDFPQGRGGTRVSRIGVDVHRDPQGGVSVACRFVLAGKAALAEDLALEIGALRCAWRSDHGWTVEGEARAQLFEHDLTLAPSLVEEGAVGQLRLHCADALSLVSWPGVAAVQAADLTLGVGRTELAESYDWTLAGAARFDVGVLGSRPGRIGLHGGPERPSVLVSSEAPGTVTIALAAQANGPKVELDMGPWVLRLGRSAGRARIEASGTLTARGIPDCVSSCIPGQPTRVRLKAEQEELSLIGDGPGDFEIAPLALGLDFASGGTLDLGEVSLAARQLQLELKERTELVLDLHASIPRQLDNLFGTDSHACPARRLFEQSLDLRLSIGEEIRIGLLSSPLKPLQFYERYAQVWADWNFGEMGILSLRVPEFSFAQDCWKASAGVELRGDLKLPLRALRSALARGGFPVGFLAAMPDAIPLIELDLGQEQWLDRIEQMLGGLNGDARGWLQALADLLPRGIERLPARLAEYSSFHLPQAGILDITVSTRGGFSFGFRPHAEEPIRVLLPAVLGSIPELIGITLGSLSFGLDLGGRLVVLRCDAYIDRHDLAGLIFALSSGRGESLSNRIVLKNLIAVVPSGLPAPIPLFYEQIGWEYRDPLGLGLEFHAALPEPELCAEDYARLLDRLYEPLREEHARFRERGIPQALGQGFTVGPSSVSLPAFLGGARLEIAHKRPAAPASLPWLLDALKTADAGCAVQAIPLEMGRDGVTEWLRIGRCALTLGPLETQALWCLSTEDELREHVLNDPAARARLEGANLERILETLPHGSAREKGFLVLLTGHTVVGELTAHRVELAMAFNPTGGLETGVCVAGTIAETMEARIEGILVARPSHDVSGAAAARIEGRSLLSVAGTKVLEGRGEVQVVPGERFETQAALRLTDAFRLDGQWVIGAEGMTLAGRAAWRRVDGSKLLADASALVSGTGIDLALQTMVFAFEGSVSALLARRGELIARVELAVPEPLQDAFQQALAAEAMSAQREAKEALDDFEEKTGEYEHEASLRGMRERLPQLCATLAEEIERGVRKGVQQNWPRGVPGRGAALRGAVRQAMPYIEALERLGRGSGNPDGESTRERLKTALQGVLEPTHVQIRVAIPGVEKRTQRVGSVTLPYPAVVGRSTLVYERNLLEEEQIEGLRNAIQALESVATTTESMNSARRIYERVLRRYNALEEVRYAVEQQTTALIPRIEELSFRTFLEALEPGVEGSARIRYRRHFYELRVPLRLDDIRCCARQLAAGFRERMGQD